MSFFYWHTTNALAKKLAEVSNAHAFTYTSRGELEFKIQKYLAEAGYDIWPTCHTILGTTAGTLEMIIPLNPDLEIDRAAIKLCKNQTPWAYVKLINGPKMKGVIGYASHGGSGNPYAMGAVEMAQKGITSASFVPRPV